MKKKILLGSIIAVVLLTLVSFSSVVGYSSVKSDLDISVEKDATPIALVFQLIHKLRQYPDIENVETEDEILQFIEGDEELKSIFEQLSGDDCDCEDNNPTWERIWPFPFICIFIGVPFFMLGLLIAMTTGDGSIGEAAGFFGYMFNCFWH